MGPSLIISPKSATDCKRCSFSGLPFSLWRVCSQVLSGNRANRMQEYLTPDAGK